MFNQALYLSEMYLNEVLQVVDQVLHPIRVQKVWQASRRKILNRHLLA